MQVDAGLSLLDAGLGAAGESTTGEAVSDVRTLIAVASLGASGAAVVKVLARKFSGFSKKKKFAKFSHGLFEDIKAVNPRSRNATSLPSGGVMKLAPDNFSRIDSGEVYLYVVDELNNMIIAKRGSSGRSGVKHSQLNGGASAKAAGEIRFFGGNVEINNSSGRYRAQSPESLARVKALLQSQGLSVVITGPL